MVVGFIPAAWWRRQGLRSLVALVLISAPPLTSQDSAQTISSLYPRASLSVKGGKSHQLTGLLGGLTEKTHITDSEQSLAYVPFSCHRHLSFSKYNGKLEESTQKPETGSL